MGGKCYIVCHRLQDLLLCLPSHTPDHFSFFCRLFMAHRHRAQCCHGSSKEEFWSLHRITSVSWCEAGKYSLQVFTAISCDCQSGFRWISSAYSCCSLSISLWGTCRLKPSDQTLPAPHQVRLFPVTEDYDWKMYEVEMRLNNIDIIQRIPSISFFYCNGKYRLVFLLDRFDMVLFVHPQLGV
jgi:hypothetical protein